MKDRQGRLPGWMLERLKLDELAPEQRRKAREVLEQEPGGLARLEELEASDMAVLEAFPPAQVAAEVARRGELERFRRRGQERSREAAREDLQERVSRVRRERWLVGLPALSAALLGLIILRQEAPTVPPADTATGAPPLTAVGAGLADDSGQAGDADSTRIKGLDPHLAVYRQDGSRIERLDDHAPARAHELLQLSYVAAGRTYGVVFSVDGAGGVTLHYPEDTRGNNRLEASGEVRLPHSYELDAAPGFERFFLVTSNRPFSVDQVLEAGRTLARAPEKARVKPLPLPAELSSSSILLEKVTP